MDAPPYSAARGLRTTKGTGTGAGRVAYQLKTPVGIAPGQQLDQLAGLLGELAIGPLVQFSTLVRPMTGMGDQSWRDELE